MTPKIQDKKLPAHKYTKAAIKPVLGKLVRVDQVPGIFQSRCVRRSVPSGG